MAEASSTPEEKKSSRKLIIIAVVGALLLLMAGLGVGYFVFVKNANTGHPEQATGEKAPPVPEKPLVYFDMSAPMTVNFPKGLEANYVQMSVSFLAINEETVAALKTHEPMLRNNLMMKINAQDPGRLKSREGKEALRTTMLTEVNDILSKMAAGSSVKEVFVTAFVMQ